MPTHVRTPGRRKRWRARAVRNGKTYNLGYYLTEKEASEVESNFDKAHPRKRGGRMSVGTRILRWN